MPALNATIQSQQAFFLLTGKKQIMDY